MNQRTPTAPSRYALQMLTLLESWGIGRESVLERAGLDQAEFNRKQRNLRITLAEAERIYVAAAELSQRKDLAFEFGLRLTPTSHGLLGYGLIGSPDIHAVWSLAIRQQFHLTAAFSMAYRRSENMGRAEFAPVGSMSQDRVWFYQEVLAVATHTTMRLLLGERMRPYDVRLAMRVPEHIERYLALSPTRFHFSPDAPPGVIVSMDAALLALPLPMPSPDIVAGVEKQLNKQLPSAETEPSWVKVVCKIINQAEQWPVTLKGLAAQLDVSERTVDRRLKQEGVLFSELHDGLWLDRACTLLSNNRMTVAEVAERLGYQDAANFSRAFRRRTQKSPSEYRTQHM
ncbi:AraC family transcriptional regulator [Roseateles oligotrophus]|uniref:AraC family transcriptional regulator n=1 Tax=Roseateles oligotrophus TaxID=1769250 RepID=A0ABT2YA35_9BURK|nr:AraC family transcriptional regulator [Roseateles oligotrophus]MCV2366915.1 AraC family transcriptional regulator [Roseateles oligotrophus]